MKEDITCWCFNEKCKEYLKVIRFPIVISDTHINPVLAYCKECLSSICMANGSMEYIKKVTNERRKDIKVR